MPNQRLCLCLDLQDGQGGKAEQDRPMGPAMGRSTPAVRFSIGMTSLLFQPCNLRMSPSWFPVFYLCSLGGFWMQTAGQVLPFPSQGQAHQHPPTFLNLGSTNASPFLAPHSHSSRISPSCVFMGLFSSLPQVHGTNPDLDAFCVRLNWVSRDRETEIHWGKHCSQRTLAGKGKPGPLVPNHKTVHITPQR